jgi:hypothetical protein
LQKCHDSVYRCSNKAHGLGPLAHQQSTFHSIRDFTSRLCGLGKERCSQNFTTGDGTLGATYVCFMKHFYEGNARVITSQYRNFLKQLIKKYLCASMWMEVSSPLFPSLPLNMILSQLNPLSVLIVHLHKIPLHLFLPSPWCIRGHFLGYLPARILYVFLKSTCQFYISCLDFSILITLYRSEVLCFLISKIVLSFHPLYIQIFSTALCFHTFVIYMVSLRYYILQP